MAHSSLTLLFLSCILLVFALTCQAQEETASTKLSVYHQLDGEYIKRGEIVGLPGVPEYIPTDNEVVDYKTEEFYQIKVKDERTGKIILSSVRMCQMVASEWKDEITLHLDENNHFYYLSYYAGSDNCQEKIEFPVTTKPFTTIVHVVQPAPAPKPVLGSFTTQKQKPKTTKATAEVNDEIPENKEIEEKTFFQKYWYVLLGGAFMLMSMGAGPEPPQGGAATAAPAKK